MNETLPKRSQVTGTTAPAKAIPVQREEGIPWERIESTSKPGHFYYFNPITGALSVFFLIGFVFFPATQVELREVRKQFK